jgi:hypothetical protein
LFLGFVGRGDSCALTAVWSSGAESVVVASLREVAIVLFEAIVPNTFLREVPPTTAVSSSAGASASADADLSSANSSPSGPLQPEHRAADTGPCEPGPPHPGHISSWPKREGSWAAVRQLRSNNRAAAWFLQSPLCCVRFDSPFGAPIIPSAWAEGRALLRSHPSAVPGAETEWGGTRPPSAIRDRHQSAKPPPRRSPAYSRPHPCSSVAFAPATPAARHAA